MYGIHTVQHIVVSVIVGICYNANNIVHIRGNTNATPLIEDMAHSGQYFQSFLIGKQVTYSIACIGRVVVAVGVY